jgi:mono/diheme cytochrome c family protein
MSIIRGGRTIDARADAARCARRAAVAMVWRRSGRRDSAPDRGSRPRGNLDAGKSAARLFADSCASCHHSARGLAKGRFRLTLYLFLQKRYASSSDSASALASYLQSVDVPLAAAPHAVKRPRSGARSARPPRPPMAVPNH